MPRQIRETPRSRPNGTDRPPMRPPVRDLPLHALREARQLTQTQLAEELKSGQAAVSKLERRNDMHVSSLRRFVEALGGRLEILARFPDGTVRIVNFDGEQGPRA